MDAQETPHTESEQDAAPIAARSKRRGKKADFGLPRFGWKLMVIATTVAAGGIALVAATTTSGYQEVSIGHAEQGPSAGGDLVAQTEVRHGEIDPDGQHYLACMRDAVGSADSLVRWVDACREWAASVAAGEVHYLACMRDAVGSADSLVRWVPACRERAASVA